MLVWPRPLQADLGESRSALVDSLRHHAGTRSEILGALRRYSYERVCA